MSVSVSHVCDVVDRMEKALLFELEHYTGIAIGFCAEDIHGSRQKINRMRKSLRYFILKQHTNYTFHPETLFYELMTILKSIRQNEQLNHNQLLAITIHGDIVKISY